MKNFKDWYFLEDLAAGVQADVKAALPPGVTVPPVFHNIEAAKMALSLPNGTVIAFDFDQTLTSTTVMLVDGKMEEHGSGEPYGEVINHLFTHNKLGHKVIVITARVVGAQLNDPAHPHKISCEEFVQQHNLPIQAIKYSGKAVDPTTGKKTAVPKGPMMKEMSAQALYDDNANMVASAHAIGALGVLVKKKIVAAPKPAAVQTGGQGLAWDWTIR